MKCQICFPETAVSPTVKKSHDFLAAVAAVLSQKNAEYGSSAEKPMRVFSKSDSLEQLRVRIDDKLSRIACGKLDEASLEDTLIDLVGYLALYAALQPHHGT